MIVKYKHSSAWKPTKWGGWSFYRKSWHILAVMLSLLLVAAMVICVFIVVVGAFMLSGVLSGFQSVILLEIAHVVFD